MSYSAVQQAEEDEIFGEQVRQFLTSPLGQYVHQRGLEIRDQALTGLANADPYDGKTIQSLQNDIKIVELLNVWLAEAIEQGVIATQLLDSNIN